MKVDFLGVPVDSITLDETINVINNAIIDNRRISHVVINAGKVVMMKEDRDLFDSVISCDIVNADGQSIVWASRFLGNPLPERVAGIDLMQRLVDLAYNNEYKCFFFGAKENVVKRVAEIYSDKYSSRVIAGYRNGYFSEEEEPEIARQIAGSGAQLLFVALTSPKKEKFLHKYGDILKNINFTMGVGGSFDVVAGETSRAPLWMQSIGMEWFYRFLQEPRRMWHRYFFGNLKFIQLILKEKLRKKCNRFAKSKG